MKPRISITDLSPAAGSRRNRKRVGRGPGSGSGKTAGRGHKGYGARSGSKASPGFEGGQMPLVRRVPKRGFNSPFRVEYSVVNVRDLNKFSAGAVIDPTVLKEARLAVGRKKVKILGGGKLERNLTVKAHAFSDSAKAAIEAAGGRAETLG